MVKAVGAAPHTSVDERVNGRRVATVVRRAKQDPARHAQQVAGCLCRESSVLVAADQIVLGQLTPVFAVAPTTGSGGDAVPVEAVADEPFGEIKAFADLSTRQTLVVVQRPQYLSQVVRAR